MSDVNVVIQTENLPVTLEKQGIDATIETKNIIATFNPVSFVIGEGSSFGTLDVFNDDDYVYFVGDFEGSYKVNRYDTDNVKESRTTETRPLTIEACEALFD